MVKKVASEIKAQENNRASLMSYSLVKSVFWAGLLGGVFIFFLSGCVNLSSESRKFYNPSQGTLSAYINFSSPTDEEISFTLKSMQLINSDEKAVSFPADLNLQIKSGSRQILLEEIVPPAHYQKVGFLFSQGAFDHSGTSVAVEHPEEYIFLNLPFVITPQKNTTIYINFEVGSHRKDALKKEELFFRPRVSRREKPIILKSLMLYVTNIEDDSVYVIDRMSKSVVSVIRVGKKPKGIAIDPEGTYVYVANYGSNTVSIIDTMTNELEETVYLPLGIGPSAVAVSPDGKYVFSANTDSDNVSLIDADLKKAIDMFEVGRQPVDLKVSPSGRCLYVSNKGSDDFYIFNLENRLSGIASPLLKAKVPLRSNPWGIAVGREDPFSYSNRPLDRLFIANFGSSSLFSFVIDVDRLMNMTANEDLNKFIDDAIKESSVIQCEYGPTQIVFNENSRGLYVSNQKGHSVSSFSSSTNIQENQYPVGRKPIGLALDKERNYLYVANSGEENISIIDLRKELVIDSIRVGKGPFGIDLIQK